MQDIINGGKTVDMLRLWRRRLLADALASKTVRDYMRWGGRMCRRWNVLHSDTFAECVEIASASMMRQAYSATTIHHYQTVMARFARDVFGWPPDRANLLIRARAVRPALPCPDTDEVSGLIRALTGKHRLIALLCYCCGLRISEAHQLTIGDIDSNGRNLTVRTSKGSKGRHVPIPPELVNAVMAQLRLATSVAVADITRGDVFAPLSGDDWRARPGLARDMACWPLFGQKSLVWDARISRFVRVFMIPSRTEKAFHAARIKAKIPKHLTPHRLRDAYAVHSLLAGVPVNVIQARMGHACLETTCKYLAYMVSPEGLKQFPGLALFGPQSRAV